MDLPRIELGLHPCEGCGMPFTYRPQKTIILQMPQISNAKFPIGLLVVLVSIGSILLRGCCLPLTPEAIAAKNWFVSSWLERYSVSPSALRALYFIRSSLSLHSCFFQSSTGRTSNRFVLKSFLLIEFLFGGCPCKFFTTIAAS